MAIGKNFLEKTDMTAVKESSQRQSNVGLFTLVPDMRNSEITWNFLSKSKMIFQSTLNPFME